MMTDAVIFIFAAIGLVTMAYWSNELIFKPILWGLGSAIFETKGSSWAAIKRRPFRFLYLFFTHWPWNGVRLYFQHSEHSPSVESADLTWTPPFKFERYTPSQERD